MDSNRPSKRKSREYLSQQARPRSDSSEKKSSESEQDWEGNRSSKSKRGKKPWIDQWTRVQWIQ